MNDKKRLSISMTKGEVIWGIAFFVLQQFFLGFLLQELFLALDWELHTDLGLARLNAAYFGVSFLLVVVIFRKFLAESLLMIFKRFWGFVQAVILGLTLHIVLTAAVDLLLGLFPPFDNANNQNVHTMIAVAPWIKIGTIFLAPVTEECLYRGLLFRGIYKKSRILAYVVSVSLFSLVHIVDFMGQLTLQQIALSFLQYIPGGVALAWTYQKADTLMAPVLMHCLINLVAVLAGG